MRSTSTVRWLGVAALGALGVVAVVAAGLLDRFELPVRDALLRRLQGHAPAHVAAVVIDERALTSEGPWPWPRARLADVVDAVCRAGAAGVVLDVLLVEPGEGDEALAAALGRLPAVLVAAPDEAAANWLEPPPALRRAARLAHGLFELDHDGVLRRFSTTKQIGGTALAALPFAAGVLSSPELTVPVGRTVMPGFRSTPMAVPRIGAAELVRGRDGGELRDRVVFIGLMAAGLGDRVMTPVTRGRRPDPGVLVQAAATESLLTGNLIRPLSPLLAALPAAILVLLAGAVATLGGPRRLAGQVALLVGPSVTGAATLAAAGVALPVVALTLLVLAIVLGVEARSTLHAWRSAGDAAALLSAAAGDPAREEAGSPEARLALVERLAAAAARRRIADEESRGVVAHELKTPLTSLRGLSQMLRDLDLSADERRRAAGLLVGEAERLERMVVELLELERLPRRSLAEVAEDLDLSALLGARAVLLGEGHGRTVRTEIEPGLIVAGDVRLLERVVDNLLANAFKFSPPGTDVEINARRVASEVVIEVRDHGEGIAAAEQGRIFERFVRGAAVDRHAGLGLGLALVHEVITWHGGRVTVHSAPGEGSVFRVRLPDAEEEESGEDRGRR